MNRLEQVTVESKIDLSTLWDIVKKRFPNQTVWYQKNKNSNILMINTQYCDVFSQIFALWLHQQFYIAELKKIVNEYEMITPPEKEHIFSIAKEKICKEQGVLSKILQEKILAVFANSHDLKLEGFFNFCMQEYWEELEIIVEECLDDYLSEQDYLEFLDLLQYYIAVEEYRFGHLTVVAQSDGKYQYYDENIRNITAECLGKFLMEYEDEDADPDPDDCLITILILLLPEKITLYGIESMNNKKFLKTLKNIFGNRLVLQRGIDVFIKKNL